MDVTQAAFARLKGWDRSTVSQYAKTGRIVLTASGSVDVDASEERLAESADPSKEGVRERHRRDRNRKGARGIETEPNDTTWHLLQKARAQAEQHRAALLKLEREEKEGLVCDAEAVRKASFNTSRPAMSAIMSLRFRIDPLLAGEADDAKRAAIWDRELRAVCEEIIRASDAAIAELTGK
jgi:hypothetical protein